MAALTPTQRIPTELAGKYKLILVSAAVGSSSDTIVLTQALTGVVGLVGVVGAVVTGGLDANFSYLQVSVSSMTITILSFKATGAAADDFTGTTVDITVLGKTST